MADATPAYNSPLPINLDDLVPAYVPTVATWVEGDHPTANPDGVTVSNVDYSPKTQEEKAALLHVEMVQVLDVAPAAPYPEGTPADEEARKALLRQAHPPMDLVAAEDADAQNTANLAVAGSIPERTSA
jgi:hypothetical protein